MQKTTFLLVQKKQLTHDVYELIYSCPELIKELPKPWQYVMFQLAPGLNRAYSIASSSGTSFTLIIKRIPDGKWSPIICDADVWSSFSWMLPLGHFVLQENLRSKCFIGTGTGFAPLYFQMCASKNITDFTSSIAFIFGVRSFQDAFYEKEITEIGEDFSDFQYRKYFSREDNFSWMNNSQKWYVIDWITQENIVPYDEFYLCGSPAMVKDAREKLELLGVSKEMIFWEQF